MSPKNDSDSPVSVSVTPPSSASTSPSQQLAMNNNRCRPTAMLEREKFYLDQIKQLEAERNQLRKDAEREKQAALAANERLAASLEESQCKLEALAESLSEVRVAKDDLEYRTSVERAELQRRLREAVTQSDAWRAEYATLAKKCAELETDLVKCREYSESSCASLKDLAYLGQLLGISSDGDEEILSGGDDGCVKGVVWPQVNSLQLDTDERLVDKYVRGIRAKVAELQKKDSAYQQTLREADKIVAEVEQRYQAQIADLQIDASKLREKLASMERICDQLRRGLKLGSHGSQHGSHAAHGHHPASPVGSGMEREMVLLEKLVDAENSAMKWKEKAYDMEKAERSSCVKIMELEKKIADLKMDLRDQDKMFTKINQLQEENSQLQIDYDFLAATRRQLADVEARNKLLECRVEELDASEKTLQETVDRAMDLLRSKDEYFDAEMGGLRRKLEEANAELTARDAEEAGRKSQTQTLNEALAGKEFQVRRQREMINSMEECHRNEITKLTNQLQVTESRCLQLQQDLSATSEQLHNLQNHLRNEQNKYERNLVQVNFQLVVKDDEIQQLKDQLRSAYSSSNEGPVKVPGESKMDEVLRRISRIRESLQNLSISTMNNEGPRFESVEAIDLQLQELSSIVREDVLDHVDNDGPQHRQDIPQFMERSLGEEISSARRESSSSYCSSVASEAISEISIVSDGAGSVMRQRVMDMEDEMKKKEEEMVDMKEKLRQAEEEGAVLASQLMKTKEDLIQEKAEATRLLLEVANRKNRQIHAMDDLRRENAVLRNEIALLRQRILVAEEQHKKLIHLVAVEIPRASSNCFTVDSGVDISSNKNGKAQSDSGVPVRRRFSADEKAPRMMTKVASASNVPPARCRSFSYGQQGMQAAHQSLMPQAQGLEPIVERSPGLKRSTSSAVVTSNAVKDKRQHPVVRRRSIASAQATSCMSISRKSPQLEERQKPVARQRSMSMIDRAPTSLPLPTGGLRSSHQLAPASGAYNQTTSLPVNVEEPPKVKKPIVIKRTTSTTQMPFGDGQTNCVPLNDADNKEDAIKRRHSFVSKIPRLSKRFVVRRMSTPAETNMVPSNAKSSSKIPLRRNTVSASTNRQRSSHLLKSSSAADSRKIEMDMNERLRRMSQDFIRAFKPDCAFGPPEEDCDADDEDLLVGSIHSVDQRLKEEKLRLRTISGSSTYSCSSAVSSPHSHSSVSYEVHNHMTGGSSSGFNSLEDDTANNRSRRHHDEKVTGSKSTPAVGVRKLPLVPEMSNQLATLRLCGNLGAPSDFKVTRYVGDDAVLLAWEPPVDDRVSGYNIFVDGEFNSRVRSAHRTKALVSGITRLQSPGARVTIEIRSTTVDGDLSPPGVVQVGSPNAPFEGPVRPKNEVHSTRSRRQLKLALPSSPETTSADSTPLSSPDEQRHLALRRSRASFGDTDRTRVVSGHRPLVRSS